MNDGSGVCVACDVTCLTCSVAGDASACVTCPDDRFLSDTNTCDSCDPSCAECSASTSSDCTSCVDG